MDRIKLPERIKERFGKYKFVLLILCLGLLLMLLPSKNDSPQIEQIPMAEEQTVDISDRLQQILAAVDGAGRVEVMLTQSAGEEMVYQTDMDVTGEDSRQDTVIVTDGDRTQNGLIKQVNPPVYQGAIIVCQGADSAAVRYAVIDAVSKVTGLGSDKIAVLKMK